MILHNPTNYNVIQQHQLQDEELQDQRQLFPQQFPLRQITPTVQIIMNKPNPESDLKIALPSDLVGPMVV